MGRRLADNIVVSAIGSGGSARSALRKHWVAAAGLLLVAALLGSYAATTLRARDAQRAALPQVSGRLRIAGIDHPISVDRDRIGVPHVEALSERDAFFALGYVHAQDRPRQLLELRRRAHGRAAELAGREALDGDRVARLMDFRGLAERQWEQLDRATRRTLEVYASGVAAGLQRLGATDDTGDALEHWRPQDSMAVFKLFAFGLSETVEASLVLNEIVESLGSVEARRFFPPRSAVAPPEGRATATAADWTGPGVSTLRRALGLAGFGVGSTAFAVGGRHTESGRPMLVADSHFEPTSPPALHLAHLRAPGLDIAGATLPGVPLFWWGRNPELAWATVSAGVVVTDLYTETTRKDGAEYHDGRRWRPLEKRSELLRVRGGRDVTLEIRETVRGPLLPSGAGEEAISFAWTGARTNGASGIGSLLAVARAKDAAGVRAALQRHHEPPIALVWVDTAGGAGLQLAGWIPRRTLSSQMLPLPGRARWYDWSEPVAFDALTSETIDDGEGFLIAADQLFEGVDEEEPMDGLWRSGPRRDRLTALLTETTRQRASLRELAALTGDVDCDRSRAVVAAALALAEDAIRTRESLELVDLLRGWDGLATLDSVGASAYHTYLQALAETLFAERMGRELYERYIALRALDLEALVHGVLRDAAMGGAGDSWADPDRVRRAVVESLRKTWLALSFRHGPDPRRWGWGPMHELRFRPLVRGPRLGPFPYGGAPHAVLVGSYALAAASDTRFDVQVAATARFAVDADALDLALVALAPGQSEHPSDPHFDDGVEGWLAGRADLLATRRIEVEDRSVARLVLEPVD